MKVRYRIASYDEHGEIIAIFDNLYGNFNPQLVLAAPDLLEALEALVRFDNGEISSARGNYENLMAASRAAIKKAKGIA